MKKYFKKFIILIGLTVILTLPHFTLASPAFNNLKTVGEGGANPPYVEDNQYKLAEIVGLVIQAFLGLLGVLFLIYMLYAGYNWLTAQGDEEKVTKAKDTIQRAIIGVIIVIAAYAISYFVLQKLVFSGGILR